MKERITITIDEDMLSSIDAQVDGTVIKNRSHAIELNLSKALQRKNISQAVILAGGPYELKIDRKDIPTTMLEVNGKTILEHNILMLKKQGIKKFIIAVGHKKEIIKNYLKDGKKLGVEITYIEEDVPLGTAGALKEAAQHISGTFLVCNGDELKSIDIKEMYEYHRKQGTLATIAVTTTMNPKDYGVVILNGNRVYSFVEKPKENIPTNLINAGLYIFEPEVINEAPEGYGRLEEDVFPKLANREECAGYVFYGEWQDVRSEEALAQAIKNWNND
ncbi:NTP transferase domain-containing protein [Candidatus Woesearchaeota archaeon]|nr:NTP transferase domain-containing protein [Candidatus Woesearchaeota archaeon]